GGGGPEKDLGGGSSNPRCERPAGAVEDVERGGADDGHVADAQRERRLRADWRGGERGGGGEEGAAGEHVCRSNPALQAAANMAFLTPCGRSIARKNVFG